MAAMIDARLPQVRGRDRLLNLIRGDTLPKTLRSDIRIRWGAGLEATVNPSMDGSLQALYMAQWVRPALVPVLEACLQEGDLFVDVGANIGLYTTCAAKIVGPTGVVLAVEPVPRPRAWLERICAENGLAQVKVISTAVGDRVGSAWMRTTEGASGLSTVTDRPTAAIPVSITTLDSLLAARCPALVKIDVEGHEFSVLTGARKTLETTHVPVVFEAPDFGGGDGTIDCVRLLESIGYRLLSLTTRGARAFDASSYSHNLLAVDRNDRTIQHKLEDARFPRTQNT